MQIRKTILKQDIHIVFSRLKRQRPLTDILEEQANFIDKNSPCADVLPEALVGKRISHKFEVAEDETKWYAVQCQYEDS